MGPGHLFPQQIRDGDEELVAFLKAVQVVDDLEAVYVHADDAVAALGVGVHGLCRLRVEGVHVVQIGQEIELGPVLEREHGTGRRR